MVVVCAMDVLSRGRPESIRRSLRAVSSYPLYVEPRSLASRFELTAGRDAHGPLNRRDWTFDSIVESVVCHYRELWIPRGAAENEYFLAQAYFHLLEPRGLGNPPVEILAFHWHPRDDSEVAQLDHGRRPHYHFTEASSSFPDAHLVSTLAVPIEDQSSVDYLDSLLDHVVDVFRKEVLR